MSVRPERLRLFVAIALPERLLRELGDVVDPRRSAIAGARWTPVENQHATLKFLGNVDLERREEIADRCRTVARDVAPARAWIDGLGAFPSARRARVLWAGLEDPDGVCSTLARELDEALMPLGFEPEKRRFTPHLTLARLKVPASVAAVVENVQYRSDAFDVPEFHLYRSRLSPKGARYEVIETFVLEGDGTERNL